MTPCRQCARNATLLLPLPPLLHGYDDKSVTKPRQVYCSLMTGAASAGRRLHQALVTGERMKKAALFTYCKLPEHIFGNEESNISTRQRTKLWSGWIKKELCMQLQKWKGEKQIKSITHINLENTRIKPGHNEGGGAFSNSRLCVNNYFSSKGDQIPYLIQEKDRIGYILWTFHAKQSTALSRALLTLKKNKKSRAIF